MKIGIIGYGKMGRLRHDVVNSTGIGEVLAIYEPYGASPPEPFKVDSVDAILTNPDIDSVFVATVNSLNKDMTIAALKAGKHVFCEKPPAFTGKDVEEIRKVEAESGKVLMYGFNHRHHQSTRKMKEIVDSGTYGKILWMRGRYGKSVDADYFNTWRAKPELAGGGILLDQGIHMLDLFIYMAGNFDHVNALVSNLYWNLPGIEDNVFAIFRNSETGCCASLHSTMTQWRHLFSFEVFMERGYMALNGLKTSTNSYGAERLAIAKNRTKAPAATWEDEEIFEYDSNVSWSNEVLQFRDCVQAGTIPLGTGDSGSALAVMQLVDKIYEHEKHTSDQLYHDLNGAPAKP